MKQKSGPGKDTATYWRSRLRKPTSGRGTISPHFVAEMQYRGKRGVFALHTGNEITAAAKAAAIYRDVISLGMDAAVTKHRNAFSSGKTEKTQTEVKDTTIGEWIIAAEKVFAGEKTTFGSYARCLRQIAREIQEAREKEERKKLGIKEKSPNRKEREEAKKRFSPKGAKQFRRLIDSAPISLLSANDIQQWRKDFVDRVGSNEQAKKKARTSANSIHRQAKALFSRDVIATIKNVIIPSPLPFAGISFYTESHSYRSKIDDRALLLSAQKDFVNDPEALKVILLALGAGLRRGEIDGLRHDQVDYENSQLVIEVTKDARVKTLESEGCVPIDGDLLDKLAKWKKQSKGPFVIEAEKEAAAKSYGRSYRCDEIFSRVIAWLRSHGVDSEKPLHTLRKEAGSIVATESDIQAASQFLRHRSIAVTSAYYAHNKNRNTVRIGKLLSSAPPPQNQDSADS